MSRQIKWTKAEDSLPVDDQLQELRSTYHDSFGGAGGFMAPALRLARNEKRPSLVPVSPGRPMADNPRLANLESRLTTQERNAQTLLGNSYYFKR